MEVEVGTGTGTNQRSRTRMDALSFTGSEPQFIRPTANRTETGERHQGIVLSFRNGGLRSA